MTYAVANFLVVDDDIVSIMAIQRAMKKLGLANPLHVAANGIEALEILRGTASRPALAPPFVIILDLNMPRMSGHELLEELRRDDTLASAVVFVLTSSSSPVDIADAYRANIAGYIVKDATTENFREALNMIGLFAEVVMLPD